MRASDDKATADADAQSYAGNYNGYNILAGASATCYDAVAQPKTAAAQAMESTFTIVMDSSTGIWIKHALILKEQQNFSGCNAAGTW